MKNYNYSSMRIIVLAIFLNSLVGCDKIGKAFNGGQSNKIPIEIGDNFKIQINGEVVNVIGFDRCSQESASHLCILVKPETGTVRVKILLKPELVEIWSVQHTNNNERISFHRPNGDLVVFVNTKK